MCESQKIMNEALEKRFAVQQHYDVVLLSLKEAKLSARRQAEENNEQIMTLMSNLETIDKLKNGKEDVSDARETIDKIFHQAEKQLQTAAHLAVECDDQTEIRVWIEKRLSKDQDFPDNSQLKSNWHQGKIPRFWQFLLYVLVLSKLIIFILLLYSILVKVTETNRKCSIEENSTVICCAFDSKNPLLACGLDNGKWCLFKDDSTCSPFSEWTTNLYSSSATTGKVMCMDWDVIILDNFCIFNNFHLNIEIFIPQQLSGSRVALGFDDGTVEVWDKDGEVVFSRKVHSKEVTEVFWNKKDTSTPSNLFLTRSLDSVLKSIYFYQLQLSYKLNPVPQSAAVSSAVLGSLVQVFPGSSNITIFTWINEDSFATVYDDNSFKVHQLGKEDAIQVFDNDQEAIVTLNSIFKTKFL